MIAPQPDKLIVPAPWGIPIMLGLQPYWTLPHPVAPGARLEVWHTTSAGDFRRVLDWCEAHLQEQRPRRSLVGLLNPWSLVLSDQMVGSIMVSACDPPSQGQPHYHLHLTDPRPVWVRPAAPVQTQPYQAPPRANAGPLFGSQQ